MSLERIDQYIKQIKAIRDYESKCQMLNEARSQIVDLQKQSAIWLNTFQLQSSQIDSLNNTLTQKETEINDLRAILAARDKELEQFKNRGRFITLDIVVEPRELPR